jgi:hypothetical protein
LYCLGDSFRKIIVADEFEAKTTENVIIVLDKARRECCGQWYAILAVLTDHGIHFCANKRGEKGHVEHTFELYLKSITSNIFFAE